MHTIRGAAPVVVGLDGSDASLAALDWAVEEAESRQLPLELVHCLPWGLPAAADDDRQPFLATGRIAAQPAQQPSEAMRSASVLQEALTRCNLTAPTLPVTTTLTVAAPTGTLIERSCHAELVVLGAVGRRLRPGVGLGSVADVVAGYAKCPVIVVRGEQLSPNHQQRPVVVGLDAAGGSTELLGFAFDEATRRRTGLVALHSWTYRKFVERRDPGSVLAPSEAAHVALGSALVGWRDKFPDVPVIERTLHADPAQALIAESAASQLVVVSARAYRDMTGAVLGPVSQEVVASAHCPVAVVCRSQSLGADPRTLLRPVPI